MFADDNLLPKAMLKDLDNNKIDVYDFLQDGPLIINFWFLACEPCKKEMIYLDRYNQKYSKYGFKILSVNTDNSRTFSRVKPFVNSKKYSFTVLSDPKSLFFRKVGGIVCPYTVVVNDKGEIVNTHMGYNPGDEIKLEEEIVSLIASSIKADTSLTDSSIISILSKIELDKKILNDVTDPNK
tara:strand:- start:3148 stop:3693 length:546 start_codon:yes stop_codon:yes gene_type:complete